MKKQKKPQKAINRVISDLIRKHGGNKAEIARQLSSGAEKPISPLLLGQYATGKAPGSYFLIRWEEVFGDRIPDLVRRQGEAKVSHETKGNQDAAAWDEERSILIKSLKQFGETNDYLLKRIRELGG